jgi:seryl-tRNA synthetase
MLDPKFIRDNLEAVRENVRNRHVTADPDLVVRLYDERNQVLKELESTRASRNANAERMKAKLTPAERAPLVEEGKRLKEGIALLEARHEETEKKLHAELLKVPNMSHPSAPVAVGEEGNRQLRTWGTVPSFSFAPKDHVQLGQSLDLIDFESGAKVAGQKFYYLRNQAVVLELALVRYALDALLREGFTPMITPDAAREEIVAGHGFNPRGPESNIYPLEGTDLCLIATAEITLGGYNAGAVLLPEQLPIRLAGISHCFRREAGAAGQFSKGLYRVHQFTKVEMFVFCLPEVSEEILESLIAVEERIFQGLEIPYRIVDTCTGDLGGPAYRKFDIEAWMPGRGERGEWGEITSASNCTDYQARRLGIRFKEGGGRNPLVHTLNGTALAVSRTLIAILENFQRADGSVRLPRALATYAGFSEIGPVAGAPAT